MKKTAVCVSCFNHYNTRTKYVINYLERNGYECVYITSDYDHIRKDVFVSDAPKCEQLHVLPYYKNISFRRLASNRQFALKLRKRIAEIKPNIVYIEVPPNSLAQQLAKYKKHSNSFLIMDIFDLWPETFPSGRAKKLLSLPFGFWRTLRDGSLHMADAVTLECDMYKDVLGKKLDGIKTVSLPLCRQKVPLSEMRSHAGVELCYVGTINNIIDIPTIAALTGELSRLCETTLHIIGGGESEERLVEAVTLSGASVECHGMIFDDTEKAHIFGGCDFGLNIMRESVCVGLTMKSLDYYASGLPVINSIGGDTRELIKNRRIGINIDRRDMAATAKQIAAVTREENAQMRKQTLETFNELYSVDSFTRNMRKIFS